MKITKEQLVAYQKQVDEQMLYFYGIDWANACGMEEPLQEALEDGIDAREFTLRHGEKMDLDQIPFVERPADKREPPAIKPLPTPTGGNKYSFVIKRVQYIRCNVVAANARMAEAAARKKCMEASTADGTDKEGNVGKADLSVDSYNLVD